MIDFETTLFGKIATVLRDKFPNIFVAGEQTASPASFPAVTIVEQDNSVVDSMRTANKIENAVDLMYEVNVYSNLTSGKKAQAKKILSVIDEEFEKLGFERIMKNPIDNLQDTTIFRYIARYEGRAVPEYDELMEITNYRIYTT